MDDLRKLLFKHFERESGASTGAIAVEGFTKDAVKTKLRKMRKALGDEVMNFATFRTDISEHTAIKQEPTYLFPKLPITP